MPKHKLELIEYLKVKNIWEFEFEPGDQAAWDQLISCAASFDDISPLDDPLYDFPKKAPNDPEKWFELARLIYSGVEPFKCISANQPIWMHAGVEDMATRCRLLSPKGDVLEGDAHDDLF